jgi:hypothetical protein
MKAGGHAAKYIHGHRGEGDGRCNYESQVKKNDVLVTSPLYPV